MRTACSATGGPALGGTREEQPLIRAQREISGYLERRRLEISPQEFRRRGDHVKRGKPSVSKSARSARECRVAAQRAAHAGDRRRTQNKFGRQKNHEPRWNWHRRS